MADFPRVEATLGFESQPLRGAARQAMRLRSRSQYWIATSIMKPTYFIPFCLVVIVLAASTTHAQFVSTRGKQFIAPDGKPLLLRGTNLGNWLLPEGYMFKFKSANSPRLIETVINQLVGEDEARKF